MKYLILVLVLVAMGFGVYKLTNQPIVERNDPQQGAAWLEPYNRQVVPQSVIDKYKCVASVALNAECYEDCRDRILGEVQGAVRLEDCRGI